MPKRCTYTVKLILSNVAYKPTVYKTGKYLCSSGFLATTNQVRVVSLYASVRPSLRPGRARDSREPQHNVQLTCKIF